MLLKVEGERRGFRVAKVARVVGALLFAPAAMTCTSPGTLHRVDSSLAGIGEDEYRYTVDAVCAAHIRNANRMPEDRAVNRMARECSYAIDLRIRRQAQVLLRAEMRRQGEVAMDIPEFHDEQRLPIAGGKLGPKAGLYVSPFLGSFRQRWQLENHPSPGILAAYVVVLRENNEQWPSEYDELGLHWGVNCLFLEAVPTGGYRATMVKGVSSTPCRDHNGNVPGPKKSLSVTAQPLGGAFTQDSMIPAARFQEDNEGRAVLSVPCLGEWCQISRVGKTPVQDSFCDWDLADPTLNWPCVGKEMRVPSWFDEQLLDEHNGTEWVNSGVRAAIVPQKDIHHFKESDFSTPRHVATIYLNSTPNMNSKYFLGGLRKGANRVDLVNAAGGFQFIVTAPDGSTKTLPVLGPHRHFDAPLPGTTRWRFTVRDSGIWGPCGQNCCDSDGFQ